jgi:hypothetical protein
MKKISLLFALLSMIASAAINAQEKDFCKADCAADKKECRRDADDKAVLATSPFAKSDSKPKVLGPDMESSLENQRALSDERQKIKDDEYHSCEVSYRQCTKICERDSLKQKSNANQ